MKILKSAVHKKVIVCFYNEREENLKVSAFKIFPTSRMVLFEIYQRFKGNFFKELRVSSQGKKVFYSIQYKNGWLAASGLFHMFTQSVKFHYTFYYPRIKNADVLKMRFIK